MKSPFYIMAGAMLVTVLGFIPDIGAAADGAASPPAGVLLGDLLPVLDQIKDAAEPLSQLRSRTKPGDTAAADLLADADLFRKAAVSAIESDLTTGNLTLMKKSLSRSVERADAVFAEKTPWTTKKGKVLRGYIS